MVLSWYLPLELCNGELDKSVACSHAWCSEGGIENWPSAAELPLPIWPAEDLKPINGSDLNDSMAQVAKSVKAWVSGSFAQVRRIEDALGNHGIVNLMRCGGDNVAVKQIPNKWMTIGPEEFDVRYPDSPERPWLDLGLTRLLTLRDFPYSCALLGTYCDENNTYAVSSFAKCGDLLAWCFHAPRPGPLREAMARPIAIQVMVAVRWLHELGIAHRDLSPENVLLTRVDRDEMRIHLIDFGMATASHTCCGEVRGKLAYQAPEMHQGQPYNAFQADHFQLGVTLFAMGVKEQPWTSTVPGKCHQFERFVAQRSLPRSGRDWTADFIEVCEGLLQPDPQDRLTLGETQLNESMRQTSVWATPWLWEAGVSLEERWPWPPIKHPKSHAFSVVVGEVLPI